MVKNSTLSALFAVIAIGGLVGCGSPDEQSESITVFAAASLKNAFTAIGERFRTDNPGVDVQFDFAESSDLLAQLNRGAGADVFASADAQIMDAAARAGLLAGDPVDVASNTLTIVTAPGNPRRVLSFADLTKPGVLTVVCAAQVPCGSATAKVAAATGVAITPASEEASVTDVLNKVVTGQADAGVVYVTDALSAGDKVATVTFAEASVAVNTYPVAVLKDAPRPEPARKFVDLVAGEFGQKALAQAGFAKP